MADDTKTPPIDPHLLKAARDKGVDVETLIDRALRRELAARQSPDEAKHAKEVADAFVEDYNQRFDQHGAWTEAWRRWE